MRSRTVQHRDYVSAWRDCRGSKFLARNGRVSRQSSDSNGGLLQNILLFISF